MKNILVIGSINMDLTVHVDKVPHMGETVFGKGFSNQQGGKGVNQAVAIKKLSGNLKMIGAVGDDLYGEQMKENLSGFGVDFEGFTVEGVSSGIAVITVCNGDNCIILENGANFSLTPELVARKEELFDWADYVVMQLEIPIETVLYCAKTARAHGAAVVLNPAPSKELPKELFPLVDWIIPNEHEANDITGFYPDTPENIVGAVAYFKALGVSNVIITLGENGCVYTDGDNVVQMPAIKTKAVDTTAAGDSFIGAFVTSLADGKTIADSVSYATKVSSITVSRPGASDSIPYADECK